MNEATDFTEIARRLFRLVAVRKTAIFLSASMTHTSNIFDDGHMMNRVLVSPGAIMTDVHGVNG
jgi:hypothetical protein